MSEPTTDEYRDWKDLLESPGWARLQAHVASAMGSDSIERHIVDALHATDSVAVDKLRQVVASKREVLKIMAYPSMRFNTLAPLRSEPAEHLGRRGSL